MNKVMAECARLARRIADEEAPIIVTSHSAREKRGTQYWYDTTTGHDAAQHGSVVKAVRYLELRGLLKRHSDNQHLVRLVKAK